MDELTPRQAEILAYITTYTQERGFAPTLQEIGDRFGLSSVATVHKHVGHMVDKGYLKRERRNASRDIEVVGNDGGGLVAIPLLLFADDLFGVVDCHALGTVLIYLAALLTVISMLYYLRRALPLLRG